MNYPVRPTPVHELITRSVRGEFHIGDPVRMARTYAGIGNRQIKPEVQKVLYSMAQNMARLRWVLRSGGATGADQAFANGALKGGGRCEEFRPQKVTPEAMEVAERHHPAWQHCTTAARSLLGRNAQIILGHSLDSYVTFVFCYAQSECRGGTALGINIARAHGIPVINLYDPATLGEIFAQEQKEE